MRTFALLAAILLADPVQALSCLRPTVQSTYTQAHESDSIFIAVLGTFDVQGTAPDQSGSLRKIGYDLPATFSGTTLDSEGFNDDFDSDVIVRVKCVASWCGGPPSTDPYLAVLEKTNKGYCLLYTSPSPRDKRQSRMPSSA